jgi:8-oxo-dGTP pyrophosphatase MutT (NUDIX family)
VPDESSRWTVHGSRRVFTSDWVNVDLDDVEIPGGDRFPHYVVRFPKTSVGAVVVDGGRVLLLWRHRFTVGRWGWEIPAGWAERGEDLGAATVREIEEETGYRVSSLRPLTTYHPMSGISSHRHALFVASSARRVGEGDPAESSGLRWFSLDEVRALLAGEQVVDGPSVIALAFFLATREA